MSKKPTAFQQQVWDYLSTIPRGQVRTYAQVAAAIGKPKAFRAVASACAANPTPIKVPCHRVIRSDGGLGGFSMEGGVEKKRELLLAEGVVV